MNPFSTITDKAIILDMIKSNQEALASTMQATSNPSFGSVTKKEDSKIVQNLVWLTERLAELDGILTPIRMKRRGPRMWSVSQRGSY